VGITAKYVDMGRIYKIYRFQLYRGIAGPSGFTLITERESRDTTGK
jgi:hypothetical protein